MKNIQDETVVAEIKWHLFCDQSLACRLKALEVLPWNSLTIQNLTKLTFDENDSIRTLGN